MANSEERAPKNNKNNEAKIEDLDEYEGVNLELADQKKTGLRSPEKQKECSETDGEGDLRKNNKRKERADTYTGEQTGKICGFNVVEPKMSKLIHADDLQNKTLEAVPNMEEANNDRKEPTEIKKNGEGSEEKEPVRIEDFSAFVEDEFKDVDFLPLGSFWDHQIPLSPQESSNRNVAPQPQMQTPSDESLMLDGISLDDLAYDLQEEQGSASDLDGISLDDLANDLQEEVGSASDLDGISLADLDGP